MNDIQIVKEDVILDVTGPINYNAQNPANKLLGAMEDAFVFAEDLSCYLGDSLQYLFPFSHLVSYGPSGDQHAVTDPTQQDNKTDFQKQNVKDFILTDTCIIRGWVSLQGWTKPFVKISYRGDPDSILARTTQASLGTFIYAHLKIQENSAPDLIKVPYNEKTNRYEIEIWGYEGSDIDTQLSAKGIDALDKGLLIVRPDLVKGNIADFNREGLDNQDMYQVAPDNTMHPVLPLKIELAWCDQTQTHWDSQNGNNYHYTFDMLLRGWHNFIQVGVSSSPHGGTGFLHYRNLMSDYKPYSDMSEIARPLMPWMFDANGNKGAQQTVAIENFFAVSYIDLHILKPECIIGLHRHRDNQEMFHLLSGKAYMVMGDWNKFPDRERAFEIRTLLPGSFTLLKAGQLHSLINALDMDATLLMLGGYD